VSDVVPPQVAEPSGPDAAAGPELQRARPRKLHRAAIVSEALGQLREAIFPVVLGVFVTSGLPSPDELLSFGSLAVLVALVVSVLSGWLQWDRTLYRVDATGIQLRRGVIRVNQTWLPAERVQAVDVVRGPVQRLFGVVELHVQSAGGGRKAEVVLRALSREAAAEVRALLGGASAATTGTPDPVRTVPSRRIRRRDVLLAGATSGSVGIAVPAGAALLQVVDNLPWARLRRSDEVDPSVLPTSVGALVLIAAAVLLVVWLIGVVGAVIAFSGFTVTRDGDRLRIRRGLLERREASVPVGRVHAVRIVEGVLRQPFGLAQVRVETAGYAGEAAAARTLYPLLRRRDVPAFLHELLPELEDRLDDLTGPPRRALRRYVLPPLLVAAVPAVAVAALLVPLGLALGVAVVAAAGAWGALRYGSAGWALRDGRIVLRGRRLARTTVVAVAGQLEERQLRQNPFTRRAGLATFVVALGSRTRTEVAHLELDTARALLAMTRPR
jgi:putative membrane protein